MKLLLQKCYKESLLLWNWLKITLFLIGLLKSVIYLNNLYVDYVTASNEVLYTAKECEQVAIDRTLADLDAKNNNK